MSQENIELARRSFEAMQRGDFTFAQSLMAPDAVIVQPPEVPDAKSYEGHDAIRQAWEDWPRQWEDFELELVEVIDIDDDTLVSVTHQHGRGRDSGIEMDFEVFFVTRGRDGLIAKMEMFFSREQALKAVGLED
jgi:ketosteroid isomerase-like protein